LTEFYLSVCEERDVRIPDGFRDHLDDVAAIERALGERPLPPVPCHNDLLAENYIDDGEQLWIVDFEYSGNNDPAFELGDTAQECAFDADLRAILCEAYFGEATPALLSRMELQAVMADVGWTLWAAIQARISTIDYDFWGWAVERWDRAVAMFGSDDFGRLLGAATR
jgi:thiamine kinase-like enzyme